MKIPPLLLCGFLAFLSWLLSIIFPLYSPFDEPPWIFILLGFLISAFFIIGSILQFLGAGTTVSPLQPEGASSLVTSGVFRWSRNPMYLGMTLMLVTLSLYLNTAISVLPGLVFLWVINRYQIPNEEAALSSTFSKEYEQYKQHVRRWL